MLERFFQKIIMLKSAPVLLGRWCRTGQKLNNIKVDLANVDHCGICVHEKPKKHEKHAKHAKHKLLPLPEGHLKKATSE